MARNNTFSNAVCRPPVRKVEPARKEPTTPFIIEIDGLCEMLNIGKNTAYNLLTSGEIDSFKVGSVWKIPITSVNEYIERKCRESRLLQLYTVVNMDRDMYYERHGDIPMKY